ncbi:glycosyltransferase [Enterovirga rhinocerotis]|uniref:Rhamnosyltransferase n=1 Tax=Enterovirga rhinocerotis TaxID=1339210 RepID=A0A4R7BY14_9HYPH|nr:glycosyltransferase [Enterovirga rhinocerotis]TDR89097.1 rhamnosyltransferase [Enterovirga rhinocerotis]
MDDSPSPPDAHPALPGTASAGIVAYHPDPAELARLVERVAPDVREVVVFANSDLDEAVEGRLSASASPTLLTVIRPGGNVGLGAAYDAFVARAQAAGDRHLLILDQDSLPPPAAVPRLAAILGSVSAAGERPAAIGPRPVDAAGRPIAIARHRSPGPAALEGTATRASFIISSGSLVDLVAAAAIGPFRADFFIDAIDLEWCFRADASGFSVWVADEIRMDHRLGRGTIALPFGLRPTDQPPRRLYTFLRNQIAMLRLPHVPLAHKAKTLATLPLRIPVYLLRNRFSRDCRVAILDGLRDGIANRLGPPDRTARAAIRPPSAGSTD